jgi:transposase-like protein
MLGVVEGSSENHLVAGSLLRDLVDRGLAADIPRLFVLDGGKALHKAVTDMFGKFAAIQRCQVHKKRNVLSHLPKSEQSNIGLAISQAYLEFDYDKAKQELMLVYNKLEFRYPKAAESLLEGLEETLTVHRLASPDLLRQSLCSTNPIESANSVCKGFARRIKNWKGGDMILRNITAGFMEAEKSFHRVKGFRQIPFLISSLQALCLPDSPQNLSHSA